MVVGSGSGRSAFVLAPVSVACFVSGGLGSSEFREHILLGLNMDNEHCLCGGRAPVAKALAEFVQKPFLMLGVRV